MIRRATPGDIPRLLEMGRRFADKAQVKHHVGWDADSVAQTLEAMILGGHPLFMGEAGAIGAIQTPHPFNHAHIHAQEVFWWSEGREGLALLKALEAHCDEHCHSLIMITLEAVEPERTGRLYERLGYAPIEYSYVKVF